MVLNTTDKSHPEFLGSFFYETSHAYTHDTKKKLQIAGNLAFVSFDDSEIKVVNLLSVVTSGGGETESKYDVIGTVAVEDDDYVIIVGCNYLFTITGHGIVAQEFGDLLFSGYWFIEKECDRAYRVPIIATESKNNQIYKNDHFDSLSTSFYIDVNCSPGPSIIQPLTNQTAKRNSAFQYTISFHDYFYSANRGTLTASFDRHSIIKQSNWIDTPLLKTDNIFSFMDSEKGSIPRDIFLPKNGNRTVYFAETNRLKYIRYDIDPESGEFQVNGVLTLFDGLERVSVSVTVDEGENFMYVSREERGVDIYQIRKEGIFTTIYESNIPGNVRKAFLGPKEDEYLFIFAMVGISEKNPGLKAVDIRNKKSPVVLEATAYPCDITSGVVNGDRAYLATEFSVVIVNLTDPSNIQPLISLERASVRGIFASRDNNVLFLTSNLGLVILNVTDPLRTYALSTVLGPFFSTPAQEIVVIGSFALITAKRENDPHFVEADEVVVMDVLDPSFPYFLGKLKLPKNCSVQDVQISDHDNLVFLSWDNSVSSQMEVLRLDSLVLQGTPVDGNCDDVHGVGVVVRDIYGSRFLDFSVHVDDCRDVPPVPPPPVPQNNGTKNDEYLFDVLYVFGGVSVVTVLFCCCCCCCFLIFCFCVVSCCGGGGMVVSRTRIGRRIGRNNKKYSLLTNSSINDDHSFDTKSVVKFQIDQNHFKIAYKSLDLIEVIGTGGGGCVIYRAKWKRKNIVCVKMFKRSALVEDPNEENYSEFEREMSVMGSISHPNILRFYGCTVEIPMIGIVMEFCENGDLRQCILKDCGMFDTLEESMRIIEEICHGMEYLHEHNIIHRDLKPQNVLVDNQLVAKIMDFGLSRTVNPDAETNMTRNVGTCLFMSPELVRLSNDGKFEYPFPVDVFAFSILSFIVITKNFRPYGNLSGFRCEMKVAKDPTFRPVMEEEKKRWVERGGFGWFLEVIEKGWDDDPAKRPTFSMIEEMFEKEKMLIGEENDEKDDFIVMEEEEISDD